ncbi:hypothetical protein LCGC14_0071730 [marine sediment metagenome]|uniref:Uncharacterized protein n=1 Tax=marine sediment metagenome TaxID=412755 RepID=A0A0F9YLK9_9ZZZZ|nr:hypothetical protein [Halomonas sp.]HDZ49053.1 hypothetical protein [Halomonas sp.]HEB04414.1 hypothetical protein [Halomonas sp.]
MNTPLAKKLAMALLMALMAGGLLACDNNQGPAEEAGESIDESTQSVGESIEELGEDIEEAAEN